MLAVDFENRPMWRRKTKIGSAGAKDGLFLRVRVRNSGWRTAHGVTGGLAEKLDGYGVPYEM